MAKLNNQLELNRCPYCQVDRPNLARIHAAETRSNDGTLLRFWGVYQCIRCGGLVCAAAPTNSADVTEVYPVAATVDDDLPARAKAYLEQAVASMHAPAGAVMLAASAVDAMLKSKGLTNGTLYSRIDEAAKTHLITPEMAAWAHEIRLDANDQRHADVNADLPTPEDARRVLDFAVALGQFLFVLPARVARGRAVPSDPTA